MVMQLRWTGTDELERVAQTRLRCYGGAESELPRFVERTRGDVGAYGADYLLAEDNGQPVGTATHYPLTMWVRGSAIAAQGVAWVGAIKTARRRAGSGGSGVASTIMNEMLRRGRDAGCVVSALMPFRASFYEHFGYGVVERRNEWTLPTSLLPSGPSEGMRYYEPADFVARAECLRRVNRAGQCDVERSDAYWQVLTAEAAGGFQFIDRPDPAGPIRGSLAVMDQATEQSRTLRVHEIIFEDADAFRRQLNFLGAQRDQYSSVQLHLPADLPLNWLLKEVQLPHRPVHHATAHARPYTRMQLRILDHRKFLESLAVPSNASGSATVEVQEPQGHITRLRLQIGEGRIAVDAITTAGPRFATTAARWAAIATGDMRASTALRFGLAEGDSAAATLLDQLAQGPAPFCHEYF